MRTIVVHGSSLLRRLQATVAPGRTDEGGAPTHALYAFAKAIKIAVGFKVPERAVVVVQEDVAFKGELLAQHLRLRELCRVLGFHVVEHVREADLVASYARAGEACGDVVVVGTDKRLSQLVSETLWWYDANKDARYTIDMVRKRFCVLPPLSAQWLSLVGDDDTLKGIKGIGKKGATELLEAYGSIAKALSVLDTIKGRTGNALRAAGDDAVLASVSAATLDDGLELPRDLDELVYQPASRDARQTLFATWGFHELLEAEADDLVLEVHTDVDELDLDLAAPVGVHAIISDPSAPRGQLAGVALYQGERAHYFALEGFGPRLKDPNALFDLLEDKRVQKVGHHLQALATCLKRQFGRGLEGISGDSAHRSHMSSPSIRAPHDLDDLARVVLHRALKSEDELRGTGRGRKAFSALSVDVVAPYAARRARASLEIYQQLKEARDDEIAREYRALSETLTDMEVRGIGVDKASLEGVGVDFERIGKGLEDQVHQLAGKSFNLGSTKQLGEVLFDELKLPIYRRTKTGYSTANEALERIENAHPIVPLVIRWRRLRRLTDTWVKALMLAIDDDGRVRSSFHPARSFSGRLVNALPDLGRVPGRTEEMKRIRRAFKAKDDHVLMSVDFKQLGLYVLAHLTEDPALTGPLSAHKDIHRETASAVLEKAPEDISVDERQVGKVVNFATFASQGKSALAFQLGVEPKEAEAIIARFFERYARTKAFFLEQLELARTRGHIETIAGRRWPIGDLNSPDVHMRSYAERLAQRATHEASVADVSRRALLEADRAFKRDGLLGGPLLQIHDEVLFEVHKDELERASEVASAAMKGAYDLRVPLEVGVKVGPNWADLES